MLAFRLAAPELLVDLKQLQGLNRIDIAEDGVRLGAKVRWCEIERNERLKGAHPLMVEAIRQCCALPNSQPRRNLCRHLPLQFCAPEFR